MGVPIDAAGHRLSPDLVTELSGGFDDSAIVERAGRLWWESVGEAQVGDVLADGGRVLLTMGYLRQVTDRSDWHQPRPHVVRLRYRPAAELADEVNRRWCR